MKDLVNSDNIDLMAKKAMDFFDIPEEKRDLVNNVIGKWAETRNKAEDGIRSQMSTMLRQGAAEFADASDEEKLAMMKKIRAMAQSKMGDFMQGMRTDEARRFSDGYFDMNDEDRGQYDTVRDKFMDFFGSDDFTRQGWDSQRRRGGDSDSDSDGGRRGRGSDSDSDSDGGRRGRGGRGSDSDSDSDDDRRGRRGGDSDDDIEGIVGKLRDFLGGRGSGSLGDLLGGNSNVSGRDLLEKFM